MLSLHVGLTDTKNIKVIEKMGRDKGVKGLNPVESKSSDEKRMNKMDSNGDETKVLMQHYQRLGGPVGTAIGPSTLKGSKQVCSIYPSLEEFKEL